MHGENLFAKTGKQILHNFVIDVMKKGSAKLTDKKPKRTSETNFQKPCPPTLAKLIETSSLLPPDFNLPALNYNTGNSFEQKPEIWTRNAREELSSIKDRLDRRLELLELPEEIYLNQSNQLNEFWKNVWNDNPPETSEYADASKKENKSARAFGVVYEAINRYEQFNDVRIKLRRLAKFAKKLNEGEKTTPFVILPLAESVNFRLDEKGFISIEANAIAEAMRELQAAKLEVKRIRECEICQRIFFAGRLDKQSCGSVCANVLNVRNSRRNKEKSGEFYNRERRKKRLKI